MTRIWTIKEILDILWSIGALPEDSRDFDMKDGFDWKAIHEKAERMISEYNEWVKK